uniref:CUB domain-containing protein n=1 Tax=Geospiza parvula TaxID=87175 RepID=A0A8C3ND35_GEOPR
MRTDGAAFWDGGALLQLMPTLLPRSACGGTLRGPEGSFSSPNYPGPYPPNALCIWHIEVGAGLAIQLRMEPFSVEGTASCLFDRLDAAVWGAESGARPCCAPRFCGNVPPPTFNSNSNRLRVTFVSDSSVGARGFSARYRAVAPAESECPGPGHCQGLSRLGHLSTPNHPQPYPHQQLCLWQISVPLGHVIDLHFHNFSLESHEDCSFDFVEVHDSAGAGTASLMGRYPTPQVLLRHPGDTGAVPHLGKLRHGAGWWGGAARRQGLGRRWSAP